uniref:tRNA-uridine aminocarboxypropyltransferase n=1 Tax=Oryza brachyantha TaxID=4533 RepID=J3LQD0_ORYBR
MAANRGGGEGEAAPHHREPGQRRPMCGVCTKPLRLCLCGRLRRPPLDTTVGVTVLQHVMEASHPLNSTRVARLGLRNLAVAQVSDVNHRASFHLRTLDGAAASGRGHAAAAGNRGRSDVPGEIHVPEDGRGGVAGPEPCEGEILDSAIRPAGISGELDGEISCAGCDFVMKGINASGDLDMKDANLGGSSDSGTERLDLVDVPDRIGCDLDGEVCGVQSDLSGNEGFSFQNMKGNGHCSDSERLGSSANQIGTYSVNAINGEIHHSMDKGMAHKLNGDFPRQLVENVLEFQVAAVQNCNGVCREDAFIGAAIRQGWTMKNMDKCSISYTEKELKIDIERGVKPKIRWLSRGPLGQSAVSNGFTVTKIQMKKSKLTGEVSVFEEFSITIPPKSALLFPCQRAISIDASDCQVQHLIVLDGTWAKAQRMYHENPWLQLLPHVKLESGGVSLYSEVRHEPRAGCLSTIESIAVAMRKLGEDKKGLDDLLCVFESMIADQRRCKDENWKQKLEAKT